MPETPLKLILDITPLMNGFWQDASRSGIFFVVKNLLVQFLQREELDLYFYISRRDAESRMRVERVLEREFSQELPQIRARMTGKLLLRDRCLKFFAAMREKFGDTVFLRGMNFLCRLLFRFLPCPAERIPEELCRDAYFLSLMYAVPEEVKKVIPPHRRCTLLYDALQSILPGSEMDFWYRELISSLSNEENYFAISASSAKDFSALFEPLKDKTIPVVLLAAAEHFKPVCDENRLEVVRRKYHIPSGKKIVFSHCSFSANKNLERQLTAFCRFYRENPDWIMVFSGGNKSGRLQAMMRLADGEIPADAVVFTGYVDDADLPGLFSLADIFTFVSLYEGFGLPVLEAMCCGCPVLTGNGSSLPEVAGDAAVLVDAESADAIFDGLKKLAADAELRQTLSAAGIARSRYFSWQKSADTLLGHIRACSER